MTYKQIIEQYAQQVETLHEVAELVNVTELEQEISTFIDVHSSLEELIEYIEIELEVEPEQLQLILAGTDKLHMDIYVLQDGTFATIFE